MEDETFMELLNDYDKVVILDEHFTFNAMTDKLFGEVYEPGIYDVKDIVG
ncbi:hypothetical protein [Desemzia sp. FAM 23991]